MKICSNWHLAESPRGGISVTEKVVLKKKLTIVEYRGGRNISIMHLHMIDLITRRRDIASCPWTKLSHLGKCSHGKLCTSILVNDRTLRSTADFASALSNVNNVKITDQLDILVMLLYSSLCSRPKIISRGDAHF